jgi:L-serine deaminase
MGSEWRSELHPPVCASCWCKSGCNPHRNAFGANKAVAAASLALRGDGTHRVSFDEVIETMRQTGADMNTKHKETSRGGLAVNIAQC